MANKLFIVADAKQSSESTNTNRYPLPIRYISEIEEYGEQASIRSIALREVLVEFRIKVRELASKTATLEQQDKRLKKVQFNQLSRYLSGKQDLYSRAVHTIELALPPLARELYRIKVAEAEQQIVNDCSRIAN